MLSRPVPPNRVRRGQTLDAGKALLPGVCAARPDNTSTCERERWGERTRVSSSGEPFNLNDNGPVNGFPTTMKIIYCQINLSPINMNEKGSISIHIQWFPGLEWPTTAATFSRLFAAAHTWRHQSTRGVPAEPPAHPRAPARCPSRKTSAETASFGLSSARLRILSFPRTSGPPTGRRFTRSWI
jgi:hypothetical protein